jgi:hypothetical protein
LANSDHGLTQDGAVSSATLALSEPGFAEGAGLYAPTSSLIYVAESRLSSAERPIHALWQKPLGANALELITGVERLYFRYGAWHPDHGGAIGYFDAEHLPDDAQVLLLSILVNVSAFDDQAETTNESVSFSMSFSVPLSGN